MAWDEKKIVLKNGVIKHISKLTSGEIFELYCKCAVDPIYTIETFFEIFDQRVNKIVPFILFDFQKKIINSYEEYRLNLTNKYRQAGVSTITCAYLAWYIAFRKNRKVAIVADKLETARDELMKDVTDFIDMLPPFLHPKLSKPDKATHKGYENGSEVKAFATKKFRGMTPTFLFWDETAHAERGDEFWTAVWPSLSTGGHCAFVSCVTKETMVWTDNGLNYVKDFVNDNENKSYFIDEYDVLGKDKLRSGSLFHNNGYTTTKIIDGNFTNIEGSLTHKIFTYNNRNGYLGYQTLDKIIKDDLIAIQYGKKCGGKNNIVKNVVTSQMNKKTYNYTLNDDLIFLYALLINNSKTEIIAGMPYIYFYNVEQWSYEKLYNTLTKTLKIKDKHIFYENNTVCIKSYKVYNFYTKSQLNSFKSKKRLPKFILGLKYELLSTLVKQLFLLNKSNKIFSESLILIKQIQQILLNMGYLSNITDESTYFKTFSINSKFGLSLYELNYKQLNSEKKIVYNYDIPLGFINHLNTICNNKIDLKYYTYKELKKLIQEKKLIELFEYVNDNIYYDSVINVKQNKDYTYDFSLPNNDDDKYAHSIIYNGIIGHQTPNGLDPVFYKTYAAVKNKKSKFNLNEIYWYEDPRYNVGLKWIKKINANDPDDPEKTIEHVVEDNNISNFKKYISDGYSPTSPWFEDMCKEYKYDKHKINQELRGDFLGSGSNFIDNEDIKHYEENYVCEPIRTEMDDSTFIFEEPIEGEKYIMAIDVSSGTSEDNSTIEILKIGDNILEQVLEFEGKVSPDILGEIANRYGIRYNNAYAIIDITGGIGVTTVQKMIEIGYKNIHYSQVRNEKIKERLISYAKTIDDKIYLPGFTIGTNRGMILIEMKRVLEMREIILKSNRIISEFKTFVTHETRVADHRRSFHDDLIMALAIGIYVISYELNNKFINDKEALTEILKVMNKMNNPENIINTENSRKNYNAPSPIAPEHMWLFKNM